MSIWNCLTKKYNRIQYTQSHIGSIHSALARYAIPTMTETQKERFSRIIRSIHDDITAQANAQITTKFIMENDMVVFYSNLFRLAQIVTNNAINYSEEGEYISLSDLSSKYREWYRNHSIVPAYGLSPFWDPVWTEDLEQASINKDGLSVIEIQARDSINQRLETFKFRHIQTSLWSLVFNTYYF